MPHETHRVVLFHGSYRVQQCSPDGEGWYDVYHAGNEQEAWAWLDEDVRGPIPVTRPALAA